MKFYILPIILTLFLSALLNANDKAVCLVRIEPNTCGSGFFVGTEYVVTAAHVTHDTQNKNIRIEYNNRIYPVEVIKYNSVGDVALLRVLGVENVTVLKLAQNTPKAGDTLKCWGHPQGKWVVHQSSGKMIRITKASLGDKTKVANYYESKVITIGGMSGGPVTNSDGELVGLVSHKNAEGPPIAYHSSLESLRELLSD